MNSTNYVTGTSFISQPGFAGGVYKWGFIIIIAVMLLAGIRQRAIGAYLVEAFKMCLLWLPAGFFIMCTIGILGYAVDGWETNRAQVEGREVRLYNGDTTPPPDPDSNHQSPPDRQ